MLGENEEQEAFVGFLCLSFSTVAPLGWVGLMQDHLSPRFSNLTCHWCVTQSCLTL